MEISIASLLEGAVKATGAVAIIDVFRAFTTAAVVLANGASRITMAGTVEEALSLRDNGIGQICMGEVAGRRPPAFDFGNSPFEVSQIAFHGKAIIQRTSAGTQGIVAAAQADRLSAASLVAAPRHGTGNPRGFARSDYVGGDGQQWDRTRGRGRGMRSSPAQSSGGQAGGTSRRCVRSFWRVARPRALVILHVRISIRTTWSRARYRPLRFRDQSKSGVRASRGRHGEVCLAGFCAARPPVAGAVWCVSGRETLRSGRVRPRRPVRPWTRRSAPCLRSRLPMSGTVHILKQLETQAALAVGLDDPPRQPHPAQPGRAEGRRPPGLLRLGASPS